jgi:threonyl-tRNA synthetase
LKFKFSCGIAALTGLTRVRRFQQDDAHIFCRPAQVSAEVSACLRMMGEVRALC